MTDTLEKEKAQNTAKHLESLGDAGKEILAELNTSEEYRPVSEEDYAPDGRRRLIVSNPAEVAEELRRKVGTEELAGLFRRSGELVHTPRIGEDGYTEVEDVDLGPAQVRPLNPQQLAALIDIKFACGAWVPVKRGSKKKRWEPRLAPGASLARVHDAARLAEDVPHLRELRGVTHTPMLRPDGSVLDRPGYDISTGFLFLPDRDLELIKVPEQVSKSDLKAARDLLLTLTAEFPFVTDDDRANFYGLAFTPLLRTMLPPPYRMGIFTAPNPRSGKTFLARMIKDLHGGTVRGELPRDQEELRKAITATLVDTTAPVAIFDNLTGVVRSSVLEALLTNREHTDRLLGASRSVTVPNDRLWLATGNNCQIGGDLAPRIVFVEIDPGMPDPHTRTGFKLHPPTWVPAHRGPLLAAMLTIIRGWVTEDIPPEITRSDDYMLWSGALRSMLHWAGFPGSFGGSSGKVAIASDPDTDEWAQFLAAIHKRREEHPFTTKELVDDLDQGQVDPDALPGDLADKWSRVADTTGTYGTTTRSKSGFTKSLGRWMMNRAGRYAHGWKVEKIPSESPKHANAWKVIGQ